MIGLLLAAGNSKRMGENKLQLPLGNQTIGNRSLKKALDSKLKKIVVVTQEKDSLAWISEDHEKLIIIRSADSYKGQSFSIKAGIKEAIRQKAQGVMMILADQPFVDTEIIDDLVDTFMLNDVLFVAASNQGVLQPPIIFSSSLFPDLLTIEGDQGAKSIIKNRKEQGYVNEYDDWMSFYDIDTKDDYQWAKQLRK